MMLVITGRGSTEEGWVVQTDSASTPLRCWTTSLFVAEVVRHLGNKDDVVHDPKRWQRKDERDWITRKIPEIVTEAAAKVCFRLPETRWSWSNNKRVSSTERYCG